MIYAVPCRQGMPCNHFAKAPTFCVIDSDHLVSQSEFTVEQEISCERKKELLQQFRHYQVTAVVVRQIGQSMLQALFNEGFRVYSLPRGVELRDIVIEQLQSVTELSYGKTSPNKPQHAQGCHRQRKCTAPMNRLAMPTYRGFSIKRLWRGDA
ncbi:NifB/NifX family molybdenum-iron cluster-binding protein [Vibrio sp. RC586]|uniref:NifB/NifX family molybdenum-iron cluster-binding protein n=1 Tax=Vibrio sp. RC586 TaxID=675815 RepID=UPI0002F4B6D8